MGESWGLVDVYQGHGLTVAAQRMALPGATLYRVTIEERERLAAVFLVPHTGESVRDARWERPRDRRLTLRVAGGRIVVEMRGWGGPLAFDARFEPGAPVLN